MPSRDDVRKALGAIKRQADYEFFFHELQSPDWIMPLRAEGFLENPPKPEVTGNLVWFPFWPESQYLSRMAAKAPDLVVDTAIKIETDNPRVQEDVVDIALSVSVDRAAKLIPKIASWVRNRYSRWITNKFSQLVRHLATGGELDPALSLAKEILWFDPVPKLAEKKAEQEKSESIFPLRPDPEPRTEEWEYEQTLERAVPALADIDPIATIKLLCLALARYIALSNFDGEAHRPFDGSVYWRPAIEWQRWHQTYRDLLVNAIRDNAERYLAQPSTSLEAIEALLIAQRWDIFTRIWLYLLGKFPALAEENIKRALTDKRLFSGHEFTHEYFRLIREQFASLPDESKNQILSWIKEGPDEELLKIYGRDWDGNAVGPDIIEKQVKAWKIKKLQPIKDSLTNDSRELSRPLSC